MQICQRHVLEPDVPSSLQIPGAASRQDHRDINRRVAVAVRHPRAVHHRHMIQQRAVAVRGRVQFLEQPGEHLHVIRIDLCDLRDLLGLLLMVRYRVMRVGHANLRVGHAAVLVSHHERDDPREVALKRQHLQIEHQIQMIFPARRDARGMIDERQLLIALRLGNLDALFDVANGVEVFGELRPIALRKNPLKARHFLADRIEHAALLAQPRAPRLWIRAGAVAEQALEDHTRVVLGGQRRVLTLPADGVRVRTREPGVAGARRLAGLDGELERRHLRQLACFLGEDLIHRNAGIEPGLTQRGRHVGQEPRARFGMRAARPSGRRNALQPAQHEHLLAKRRQRAQRRCELVGRAFGQRQVVLHDHAVGHIHDAESVERSGGRLLQRRECGHHAVEQRQRQHRPEAA